MDKFLQIGLAVLGVIGHALYITVAIAVPVIIVILIGYTIEQYCVNRIRDKELFETKIQLCEQTLPLAVIQHLYAQGKIHLNDNDVVYCADNGEKYSAFFATFKEYRKYLKWKKHLDKTMEQREKTALTQRQQESTLALLEQVMQDYQKPTTTT